MPLVTLNSLSHVLAESNALSLNCMLILKNLLIVNFVSRGWKWRYNTSAKLPIVQCRNFGQCLPFLSYNSQDGMHFIHLNFPKNPIKTYNPGLIQASRFYDSLWAFMTNNDSANRKCEVFYSRSVESIIGLLSICGRENPATWFCISFDIKLTFLTLVYGFAHTQHSF